MIEAQAVEADEILWALLRSHQQRAEFARRMAEREKTRRRFELANQFGQRAQEYEADAAVIERVLESRLARLGGNGAGGEEEKHDKSGA